MAYASTIPGHPSITIPCGLDENGMPFGLQIVGKRHDDLGVLSVAAQLESLIGASDLALPAPDFQSLQAAPPLRDAPEFLTFD
jgi:Asp-tRNA(Asn)/Glu-tRNA(Gln) amidotransferase A subunit family amidase